jgi:hypothetical protein
LGEPQGAYIFPLIESRENTAMVYMYNQFKDYKVYQKLLRVSLSDDKVADIEFTASGTK